MKFLYKDLIIIIGLACVLCNNVGNTSEAIAHNEINTYDNNEVTINDNEKIVLDKLNSSCHNYAKKCNSGCTELSNITDDEKRRYPALKTWIQNENKIPEDRTIKQIAEIDIRQCLRSLVHAVKDSKDLVAANNDTDRNEDIVKTLIYILEEEIYPIWRILLHYGDCENFMKDVIQFVRDGNINKKVLNVIANDLNEIRKDVIPDYGSMIYKDAKVCPIDLF